jgi:hypothetical protein
MSERFKELHETLTALCDQFERLMLEREALRMVIFQDRVPDWTERVAKTMDDPILQARAREGCKAMREALLDHSTWANLESPESAPPTSSVQ